MAANTGTPFSVLPQFQGNLYDLQTKQALAQALMQKGLQGDLENYRPAGGGYAYVPKYGAGSAIAQLGQALLGGALQQQASQGLTDLGAQQAAAWQQMFSPTTETAQMVPQVQPGPVAPGSFGIGAGGGFTGGSPDAGRVALASALAPQITQTTQSALNPTGMDPKQAAMLAQTLGMGDYVKEFVAPSYKPTETGLLARAAGFTPEQAQAAAAGRIAQQNFIPLQTSSPGQTLRDATGKVVATNPNIGEGMMPVYDAAGNLLGTMGIPNYNQTLQAREQAKALGAAGAESVSGYRGGRPAFINKAELATGGGQGGVQPSTGRFTGYQAPGGDNEFRPSLSPAENTSQVGMTQSGQKYFDELQSHAAGATDRRSLLQSAIDYANTATKFGPGTTDRLNNIAAINAKLPSGLAFGNDDMANVQVMQKIAAQLSSQYQKALGASGTDKALENFMHGTPNPDIANKAIKEIAPRLQMMEDAINAKASAANAWLATHQNSTSEMNVFENQWRKNYDPRIFHAAMLTPEQRQVFLNQQKDVAQLRAKTQALGALLPDDQKRAMLGQ